MRFSLRASAAVLLLKPFWSSGQAKIQKKSKKIVAFRVFVINIERILRSPSGRVWRMRSKYQQRGEGKGKNGKRDAYS